MAMHPALSRRAALLVGAGALGSLVVGTGRSARAHGDGLPDGLGETGRPLMPRADISVVDGAFRVSIRIENVGEAPWTLWTRSGPLPPGDIEAVFVDADGPVQAMALTERSFADALAGDMSRLITREVAELGPGESFQLPEVDFTPPESFDPDSCAGDGVSVVVTVQSGPSLEESRTTRLVAPVASITPCAAT